MIQNLLPGLTKQLDFLYNYDNTITSLTCVRIDGSPLYVKARHAPSNPVTYEIRLAAVTQALLTAGTELIQLAGDSRLKIISLRSKNSHLAIRFTSFFIIMVETTLQGNAKGIANQINVSWQEKE
jgi:hypothetical protein